VQRRTEKHVKEVIEYLLLQKCIIQNEITACLFAYSCGEAYGAAWQLQKYIDEYKSAFDEARYIWQELMEEMESLKQSRRR
jgi:ABC-type maltose transport system permease subunit